MTYPTIYFDCWWKNHIILTEARIILAECDKVTRKHKVFVLNTAVFWWSDELTKPTKQSKISVIRFLTSIKITYLGVKKYWTNLTLNCDQKVLSSFNNCDWFLVVIWNHTLECCMQLQSVWILKWGSWLLCYFPWTVFLPCQQVWGHEWLRLCALRGRRWQWTFQW